MAARDGAPQWPALAEEVLLADELVEGARPHSGGKGLPFGGRAEERVGTGAGGASGGHGRSLRAAQAHAPRVARSGDQSLITPPTLMASAIARRIASIRPAVRPMRRTSRAT